jgi:hypothetical protein
MLFAYYFNRVKLTFKQKESLFEYSSDLVQITLFKHRVMEALDVDWRSRRGPSNPATLLWIMLY